MTATSGTANVDGYVANVIAAASGNAFAAAVIARVVTASVAAANVNGRVVDVANVNGAPANTVRGGAGVANSDVLLASTSEPGALVVQAVPPCRLMARLDFALSRQVVSCAASGAPVVVWAVREFMTAPIALRPPARCVVVVWDRFASVGATSHLHVSLR